MPITTWTITKGIPPRLHDPKPKGKPHARKSNSKLATTQGSRKRATRDSDDESNPEHDEFSLASDSESAHWPKKKAGKHQCVELSGSDEVEVANNERPGKNVEEVDNDVDNEQAPDEQEVSPYHLIQASLTYHTLEQQSQWPPTWSRPPRKACKKGIDTRPPHYNDWQSHCEVQDKCW